MALIEREVLMGALQKHFDNVAAGSEGHCVLLSGEAGIGKTALVKAFCKKQAGECNVYQGACDSLFTPRPLAPVYDVLWQLDKERWAVPPSNEEHAALFSQFFQELRTKKGMQLIVFEDIHWADEASLDFIKFLVRRIDQLPCLFILTYRDNEIYSNHPLRSVLGQLPPDSFTKLVVTALSKEAVVEMASQKGFNGEDVYSISGGNPFYVNEILASYSPGIPDNIKDSILSVYERQEEGTKNAWQIFSVIPEGLEIDRFPKMKSNWHHAINHCFAIAVIIVQNDRVVFKHELYRRTIEESLSVLRRIELNKMILDLFLDSFKEKDEIERILHYAKNANEKKLVFKYAPEVATKAASTGAHKEAAKLYLTAIEYFEDDDITQLAKFYEAYAYESYLSNQIIEARDATEKALKIWQQKLFIEKIAGSLRFLSRLYWISGNGQMAASFAERAVEMLKDQTASATKAMALLNMSDLLLNAGDLNLCMERAEKAMAMAKETGNEEIAAQALANIGAAQVFDHSSAQTGITILHQSLEVALKNSFYEAAAHCYTNLACSLVRMKNYSSAARILEEGTAYCEERHLSFWSACLLSWKARLLLETSEWTEAWNIADNLLKSEEQPGVITINALLVIARISVRQGREAFHLLLEAKTNPLVIEPQWTFPLTAAMLEYEWLTGKKILNNDDIQHIEVLLTRAATPAEKKEFDFWMNKTGRRNLPFKDSVEGTYEKALVLFDGRDDDKRKALTIVQNLDAMATYEKLKQEMRTLGINNIPRGLRSSTRSNAAFLTDREMDVLHLLKEELHNREIAAQLFISAKTVDHHISNILFKLDAATRAKAVSKAVSMGII